MSELELAVRTIEDNLDQLPTKSLQKWKGILESALVKIDDELNATIMRTCGVCGFEEYGYRDELPVAWREKGDLVICFKHEDEEVAEQIEKALEKDKEQKQADTDESLEELLAMI